MSEIDQIIEENKIITKRITAVFSRVLFSNQDLQNLFRMLAREIDQDLSTDEKIFSLADNIQVYVEEKLNYASEFLDDRSEESLDLFITSIITNFGSMIDYEEIAAKYITEIENEIV